MNHLVEVDYQKQKSKRIKLDHSALVEQKMKLGDRKKTLFNINKNDLVRVMIQALQSLDLSESASALERESGVRLHDPSIAKVRKDILLGNWISVMNHLNVLCASNEENLNSIQFLIARQKYLEQLEAKNMKEALKTLREELSLVCSDSNQLHKLASLIVCSDSQSLKMRAKWDGTNGNSRRELINDLHRYIPPHLMVPENRLEKMLLQAVQFQKDHNVISDRSLQAMSSMNGDSDEGEISLLVGEDVQPIDYIPRDVIRVFDDHTDEVWFAQFSPNGKYLATGSADGTALIYDLSLIPEIWKYLGKKSEQQKTTRTNSKLDNQQKQQEEEGGNTSRPVVCSRHTGKVTYLAWSPTSDKLLTCSDDSTINMYDIQGQLLNTFERHKEGVCAVHWAPDGSFFISAGSGSDKTFAKWDTKTFDCISTFTADYRIQDFGLDSQSGDMICAVSGDRLHIFYMSDSGTTQQYTLQDSGSITSIELSHDGRYALCGLSSNSSAISKTTLSENEADGTRLTPEEADKMRSRIHLWDLRDRRLIREFTGHEQSKYVLRCCFSACPRRIFVCCGGEDGGIYIWNTDDGVLVSDMPLKGHIAAVNSVCWNNQGRVIASASDDGTVRLYARIDRVKEL